MWWLKPLALNTIAGYDDRPKEKCLNSSKFLICYTKNFNSRKKHATALKQLLRHKVPIKFQDCIKLEKLSTNSNT